LGYPHRHDEREGREQHLEDGVELHPGLTVLRQELDEAGERGALTELLLDLLGVKAPPLGVLGDLASWFRFSTVAGVVATTCTRRETCCRCIACITNARLVASPL
jgi:hypothetical protein